MAKPKAFATETTYPLRSAAQLTGLSPERLRAWERRYRAVEPVRTPGGTRRYRASDLERLRLLKAAIAAEAQRLLSLQLATLGEVAFTREIAMPLVREIGERWAGQRMRIASEHLATAVLRSLLGSALRPSVTVLRGARIVFATLPGERHELGLLMAALFAMGAGANPLYLGPEVPVEDLLHAASHTGAAAVALSIVASKTSEVTDPLAVLRKGLPADVHLWVGGAGAPALTLRAGIDRIESLEQLEQLEQRVELLAFEKVHKH